MVAYSFKKSFVPKIETHRKRQTLRLPRKRHAQPHEPVQLYYAMRTKQCRKIIPDPICVGVHPVRMEVTDTELHVEVAGVELLGQRVEHFALDDGFDAILEFTAAQVMRKWWALTHGFGTFNNLVLIQWQPQTEAS